MLEKFLAFGTFNRDFLKRSIKVRENLILKLCADGGWNRVKSCCVPKLRKEENFNDSSFGKFIYAKTFPESQRTSYASKDILKSLEGGIVITKVNTKVLDIFVSKG